MNKTKSATFSSFFLFLLIIIASIDIKEVSASAEIESYKAIYTIISDKVVVEENIQFSALSQNLVLALPKDAAALEIKNALFNIEEFKDYKQLTINKKSSASFSIKYITENLIEETDNSYFILDLGNLDSKEIIVKLVLPESATLKYPLSSPQPSIFPTTNKVTTDGKSINIYWDEADLEESKTLMVIYQEKNNTNIYFLAPLALFLLMAVATFLIYLLKRRNKALKDESMTIPHTKEKDLFKDNTPQNTAKNTAKNITDNINNTEKLKQDLTRNLFEEERAIIETLIEANNSELWQKQLVLKTGISKVKLSRRLRNLEAKGLIEKIPFGNTNKIRLKKEK